MPITVLVLAADPLHTPPLRLDQELKELENGLERANNGEALAIRFELAARPSDIRQAMLDYQPNIVHFCGDDSGAQGITFEDENGVAKLVSPEALAGFLALFADSVECVMLNACYSEVQALEIARHIPYVIGLQKAIGNSAAIEFAVAFYDALGEGRDIESACQLACDAIEWANLPDELAPVLVTGSVEKGPAPVPGEIEPVAFQEEEEEVDRLSNLAELLENRSELILYFIQEQRDAAMRDEATRKDEAALRDRPENATRHAARYDSLRTRFIDLHQSYMAALNAGKPILAQACLADIYRLIQEADYEPKRDRL